MNRTQPLPFITVLAGCLVLADVLPVSGQLFQRLRGTEHTINVDEQSRKYVVYVPPVQTWQRVPLILVLRGGNGNARQIQRFTRFNPIARREGFAVCYPEGIEGNWNDGRDVSFIKAQAENIDDVKFLKLVVDAVANDHRIDRSRVFATGISNGAFMSHRLAAEASDVFAGVAPLVGGMPESIAESFNPQYPVSLFVIQGTADPLVPFDGGRVGFRFGRKRGRFVSTEKAVAAYLKHNGITEKPKVTMLPDRDPEDGTRTEARTWPAKQAGARVQLYIMKNGGHVWPGRPLYAPEKLIGKAVQDFNASEEIWNFFRACPPRRIAR